MTATANKTDAGRGSYGICHVIDASRSPLSEPIRWVSVVAAMKKRTRDIIVGQSRFTYVIHSVGTWPGLVTIQVWSTLHSNGQKLEAVVDPFVVIKPSSVCHLVEWALNAGWNPEEQHSPLTLRWEINCPIPELSSPSHS